MVTLILEIKMMMQLLLKAIKARIRCNPMFLVQKFLETDKTVLLVSKMLMPPMTLLMAKHQSPKERKRRLENLKKLHNIENILYYYF